MMTQCVCLRSAFQTHADLHPSETNRPNKQSNHESIIDCLMIFSDKGFGERQYCDSGVCVCVCRHFSRSGMHTHLNIYASVCQDEPVRYSNERSTEEASDDPTAKTTRLIVERGIGCSESRSQRSWDRCPSQVGVPDQDAD